MDKKMRSSMALLLILAVACFSYVNYAYSSEVTIEKPVISLTGHYKEIDGRVKDREFPVELKLYSDGTCKAKLATWMEERGTDGQNSTDFFYREFDAKWSVGNGAIIINFDTVSLTGRAIRFSEMKINGLNIKFKYKKPRS